MKLAKRLTAICLSLAGATASAGSDLWFSDSTGALGTLDIDTGDMRLVGQMPYVMLDLAFGPGGNLYGITGGPTVFRIDPYTARVMQDFNTAPVVTSLVYGPGNVFYGANVVLYAIDAFGRDVHQVSGASIGPGNSGDMAWIGNQLYMTGNVGSTDALYKVDTKTGLGTFVGNIGRADVDGLASPNGTDLYGLAGSEVFRIDLTTGRAGPTLFDLSPVIHAPVWGATFQGEVIPQIPEPTISILLMLGTAGLAARWRPKRRSHP